MQTINIKIQKAAYGGYGLGFIDGKACFVQYAVPGDEAVVEIYKDKKDFCFGKIISLTKPSESRIEPACPNFGRCGGCDYLNIDYDTELQFKKEIVLETLRRNRIDGKIIPDISVTSGDRFHYRSHASVKSSENAFGFFEKDSNMLVEFPDAGCLLLQNELIYKLNELPKTGNETKIACSGYSGCFSSPDNNARITENECGIRYERDVSLFFQQNRFLRTKMLETVAEFAKLDISKSFIDIGCGVGFFTLYLAKNAKKAFGIDISRESIKQAKYNAKLNGITNARFTALQASEMLTVNERFDVAIADPPRAGLSAKAREALKAMAPERIIYISCDPATFARDACNFIQGGYRLHRLIMIDMFPATQHIELISLFIKPG